ncbi:MAG: tetratricopeptide repeat protein [Phycisphaerae bacterium]|nr:tetratricopeptide repeat protein [Phycisphaerae bacterium]
MVGGGSDNLSRAAELLAHGRPAQAEAILRRVVQRRPTDAAALTLLAQALAARGEKTQAEYHARRAADLAPSGGSLTLLATLQYASGKHAESEAALRRAVEVEPRYWQAWYTLGDALTLRNEPSAALDANRRAMELAPDRPEPRGHYAASLIAVGRAREAANLIESAAARGPVGHDEQSMLCTALNYCEHADPARTFAAHAAFGRALRARVGPARETFPNDPDPERTVRVGLVSPDLRAHSVVCFLEPILDHLDRGRFHLHLYDTADQPDHVTARLRGPRPAPVTWRTPGRDPAALDRAVRDDRIDVLVDLAGHSQGNSLPSFARRLAPVQVTALGYPNTTGLDSIDYRLVDARTDPRGGSDALATERLVRLDPHFACYRPPADAPEPAPRAHDHTTFGSFNHLAKITPELIASWADLLRSVPRSRLVLKNTGLGDATLRQRLRDQFAALAVTPDRLDLRGQAAAPRDHLAMYHEIDVALDTFPYHGTITTCEALWMGVPVITIAGAAHAGRVGTTLLHAAGLDDLIAPDLSAASHLARALAADTRRLDHLRATLRARLCAGALCDEAAYARRLGAAFRAMWTARCASPGRGGRDAYIDPRP